MRVHADKCMHTHTRTHDCGSHHVNEVCAELAQGSVL